MNFSEINEFSLNVSLIQSLSQSIIRLNASNDIETFNLGGQLLKELNECFDIVYSNNEKFNTSVDYEKVYNYIESIRMNTKEIKNDLNLIYKDNNSHFDALCKYIYANINI